MKKIFALIFCILFFNSCKNELMLKFQTRIGNQKYHLTTNVVLPESNQYYLYFVSDSIIKTSMSIDKKGNILSMYSLKDVVGAPEIYFNKNKLKKIRYLDSFGRVSGPVFLFKKNGKLKHIYIYQFQCISKYIKFLMYIVMPLYIHMNI